MTTASDLIKISLVVTTPADFDQATITGLGILRRGDKAPKEVFSLAFRFDEIRLRNGQVAPFRGTLERILTASGEVIAGEADIKRESGEPTKFVLVRLVEIPAGSKFVFRGH